MEQSRSKFLTSRLLCSCYSGSLIQTSVSAAVRRLGISQHAESRKYELARAICRELQELAGVEKLLIAGLPALVAASTDAELQAAIAEHLKQTEKHASRIGDAEFSLRLESKTDACKPMVAMIADAAKAALTEVAEHLKKISKTLLKRAQDEASK